MRSRSCSDNIEQFKLSEFEKSPYMFKYDKQAGSQATGRYCLQSVYVFLN